MHQHRSHPWQEEEAERILQENCYDGEGLRFSLIENGKRTDFITNGWDNLAELDESGKVTKRIIRGMGIVASEDAEENIIDASAAFAGTAYHYYHGNERMDVEYITDEAGQVVNGYTYDAFGTIVTSSEKLQNRYTYNGEAFDKTTEQYYLRKRFYNPKISRFIQEDEYRGDGLNLYAFCANNPVMYVDPSGYKAKKCGTGSETEESVIETPEKVEYGEHYTKENRKKVLKSNVCYETEGYTYTTDNNGRISKVIGKLQLGDGVRNPYAQRTVGGSDRRINDDGGHLIGSQFKGSGDIDNLVPQSSIVNRAGGEWYAMEQEWASALKNKSTVDVDIKPIYSGDSTRPDKFQVNYWIDGEKVKKTITNN